ncbi:PAS domain S-box protein [Neobacillus niacini]|uniref:PAS domain-containing sensor histidine kinase n=1 Tax=Neobacillus niacini TaxID=86668 RepID=UPI0028658F33|nr:PAS domain S-box protein [Neobacillus niacini]MDR6998180.1 two-component system sporulation sensor kinase A [Neobacillus niacini]
MDSSAILIEKRNILEKHLKDGLYSYQSLFACNSDAIFAIDLSGYYVFLNPACEQITGYSQEEIAKKKFIEVIALEDVARVSAYFYQALEGSLQNYDCKIIQKNGQSVDLNVTNLPITVNGEIIGVYGVAKDITEIKRKRHRLKDSEELYRILTENSMDMIVKTDAEGNFIYVSRVSEQILGYTPTELVGQSSIEYIHKDDIDRYLLNYHKAIHIQPKSLDTYRMRKKDGSYIYMEILSNSYRNSNKEVRVISVLRDISERINADLDRKRTEQLLLNSERLSVAGQLAAGIAHEVRNPLTAIKGFLQLLNVSQEQKDYIDIIHSEIIRIEMILTELLVIAKPQAMKTAKTNLRELIEGVKTLIDTQAIMTNVQIETIYSSPFQEIICDENQLKQVFINFLKNSIEAMPAGGKITIQTECMDEKEIVIRCIDTGSGIPPEHLKRIGEPFFTTKEKGTGLGLLVSKKIIENHHGRIQIDSDENGTSIAVILPIM